MDHIVNVNAIKRKMKLKPQGQRLHNFFIGATTFLTIEQVNEIEVIVKEENKRTLEFLKSAKRQIRESA